jgi:hypothetical protein
MDSNQPGHKEEGQPNATTTKLDESADKLEAAGRNAQLVMSKG